MQLPPELLSRTHLDDKGVALHMALEQKVDAVQECLERPSVVALAIKRAA